MTRQPELFESLRRYVDQNTSQYERTLAHYLMHGVKALRSPNQLNQDRQKVAAGMVLSGATRESVELLLDRAKEYVELDAAFHGNLLAYGARSAEVHVTTQIKVVYFETRDRANALSAVGRIGYFGGEDARREFFEILEQMAVAEQRYKEAEGTVTAEIYDSQMQKKQSGQ